MDDLEDETRAKAERLFWQRSQPLLRHGRVDLSGLWQACLTEANGTESMMRRMRKLASAGVVATLDVPARERKGLSGDDADGSVEGYLSVFGNVDKVNDIVEPGAFTKTLADAQAYAAKYGASALWPLLWQHDQNEPIGGIMAAREDGHGLRITCRLNMTCDKGRQAYVGFKNGYLKFSIGYRPVKFAYAGKVRHLSVITLIEGSAVTFPANPEAVAL